MQPIPCRAVVELELMAGMATKGSGLLLGAWLTTLLLAIPSHGQTNAASAALLMSAAERRDRAEQQLVDADAWRWYGGTAVHWKGWRLHPGGVRITLVKATPAEVGLIRSLATAVAVQCGTLRQTWRIGGNWEPWRQVSGGTVPARIVLDLCSNTTDAPAVPVLPQ